MSRFLLCMALLTCASAASAQVIYQPVQYQYSANGVNYYYGGSNPQIHAAASIRLDGHREISDQPARIYTDPTGLINAHLLGYTISDARNAAYYAAPRYFVKRDLLKSAEWKDGAWSVPAAPSSHVTVYKSNGQMVERHPTTMPTPLFIFPKEMLKEPLHPSSDKQSVAMN